MSDTKFRDKSSYSDDERYRWWYKRRWGPGNSLCWVGLNPSTGDTTGRPRPTLGRVVNRAKSLGLDAVVVVNLFSVRSTDPKQLKRCSSSTDIIGEETDEWLRHWSQDSAITLAAWGAHGSLLDRGASVAATLSNPVCLGTTKHDEPRHPLYVRSEVALRPYRR